MPQKLILASSSPRRKELLTCLGVPFEVITSSAEELSEGMPEELVTGNARKKAEAVSKKHPGEWVLGADTLVFFSGKALGKPRNEEDALDMLLRLSGNTHQVMTGICLTNGSECDLSCSVTDVTFDSLPREELLRYISTGEPMDKAGAYALQGRAGAFVKEISGSYSNVIGLDISLVRRMLIRRGLWE